MVMELWARKIELKGMDVRFEYDQTKIKPSNLSTNDFAYDSSIFSFESTFSNCMDTTIITDKEFTSVVRMNIAVIPGQATNQYYKQKADGTYYIDATTSDVLIGRMSFRLFNGVVDNSTFSLKTSSTSSPETGIKINYDGVNTYQAQSAFRFTIRSSDAHLSNIEKSLFDDISEAPFTYTQIDGFDRETFDYTIKLTENKNNISLKVTPSDVKSTIKVKVPKRDSNGKLVYSGSTLEYEYKTLDANNIINVQLNDLGEEDTVIEIIVLAEDTVTTLTYKVKIHKPFAIIKGKIETPYTAATTGKNIADILIYDQVDVAPIIDWDKRMADFQAGLVTDTINADLHSITEVAKVKTNDDGTFEIKVFPGVYNILEDKPGYLDHIFIFLELHEGDTEDLGTYSLIAGDPNKDGVVQIRDKVLVTTNNGISSSYATYNEKYDFNNDGNIQIKDKVIVTGANGQRRQIVDFR